MGTDKPRIQAYIDLEIHQKLKEFQQERDLKESPALNQILREYFGIEDSSRSIASVDAEKIRILAAAECQVWANKLLTTINSKLEGLDLRLDTLESIVKPIELPIVPLSLNAADLAKRLNTAKSTVSRRKGEADFEEWSKGKDPGEIGWRYDAKGQKFFPVNFFSVEDRA